jgi:hypothetical protein
MTIITLWSNPTYRCVLQVGQPLDTANSLQLLRKNDVLLTQSLSDPGDAADVALTWQRRCESNHAGSTDK